MYIARRRQVPLRRNDFAGPLRRDYRRTRDTVPKTLQGTEGMRSACMQPRLLSSRRECEQIKGEAASGGAGRHGGYGGGRPGGLARLRFGESS